MTRPDDCRYRVLSRDDPERYACGRQFPSQELTYDHPIPPSRGGKTVWTNIVSACLSCNAQNVDKLPNHSGRKPPTRSAR